MFVNNINNTFIPNILTGSKFRIFRHFILLFIISIVASCMNVNGAYKASFYQYYEWLVFFIIFTGVIYINMYVMVPSFLLKNRSSVYFILLFLSILILLILISLSQFVFHIVDLSKGINYVSLFLSLTNSIIAFGIIIICSSTFIILKNWIINNKRIRELETITVNAELQQLKNQINPHFLFNILNNVIIMIKHNPIMAAEMLTKFNDLLSYQIDGSTKEFVSLDDEIRFLTDYLDLEKSRRNRFNYSILKAGILHTIKIPPMLFIPFIENAVKHSSGNKNMSYVDILFKINNSQLLFFCVNSKPQSPPIKTEGGLGLANIRRRLELLYKNDFTLKIYETNTVYSITLNLKI